MGNASWDETLRADRRTKSIGGKHPKKENAQHEIEIKVSSK